MSTKKSVVDQIIDLLAALEREAFAAGHAAGREAALGAMRKVIAGETELPPVNDQMPQAMRKVPIKHVPNGVTTKHILASVLLEGASSSSEIIQQVLRRSAGGPRPSDGSIYAAINRLVRAAALSDDGKGPRGMRRYKPGPGWNDFVLNMRELTEGERANLLAKDCPPPLSTIDLLKPFSPEG